MRLSLILLLAFYSVSCTHSEVREKPAGLRAQLENYDYPRAVSFFELTSQGKSLRMAYVFAKPERGNGRTVLLLHGKNFSAAYWEDTIRVLLEQGFQVLAPDQIGFGKSSKPSAYQFTLQGLAENTHALMRHLRIDMASVVGHSMGGMLATRYALMYPTQVERLVLVNPIGLEDWRTMAPSRSIDELYQGELKATPESIKAYQRAVYFDGQWKSEYDHLVEVLSGWTQNPEYPQVAWNAALTSDMIWNQPVVYEFPLLKSPTLLIIGTRDRTALGRDRVPPEQRERMGRYDRLGKSAAKAIPRAKLVEIPNVGHMPQVEAFDTYKKALLGFL